MDRTYFQQVYEGVAEDFRTAHMLEKVFLWPIVACVRTVLGLWYAWHYPQTAVRNVEPWFIVLGLIGFLISIIGFVIELEDRQSERIFRAWDIILKSAESTGEDGENRGSGSSVRQAMEYLNREYQGQICGSLVSDASFALTGNKSRECLIPRKHRESFWDTDLGNSVLQGSDLRGADLSFADLSGADLRGADLSSANLIDADLRGANLWNANLSGANLWGTDLSAADLSTADLSAADLSAADLSSANLVRADLIGADLSFANLGFTNLFRADVSGTNLGGAIITQEQLDFGCGFRPPRNLPDGLEWRSGPCPED